ncbi:MAG: hypothetical protein KKA06_04155, partial [Nanoarchaeota archaeon]|nr:hypothetical protein [Nanoarchaeota archaeon]
MVFDIGFVLRSHRAVNICKNICYIYKAIKKQIPEWIKDTADDTYGDTNRLKKSEKLLIDCVSKFSKEELDKYVYNGRNKDARKLADWWDSHQKRKKKKGLKEKQDKKEMDIIKSALGKLRKEEVIIIKKYMNMKWGE